MMSTMKFVMITMMTLFYFIPSTMSRAAGQRTSNNIHNAVNLGFVLYNQGEVDVLDATAKLSFVIKLPEIRV